MNLILTLVVVVLIFGIAWWAISQIPLPQPGPMVVRVVFALIAIMLLIGMFTGGVPLLNLNLR